MRRRGELLVLLGCLWAGALGWGIERLLAHAYAPGRPGRPEACWPADSPLGLGPRDFTLVVFAHPHCPCSRATLENLTRLLARAPDRVIAYVLFWSPQEQPEDWAHTGLWGDAAGIPGVRALCDRGGRQARRFGAATSGQVLLYDRGGRLRFRGGITAARGHAGDNPGAAAIEEVLRGGEAAPAEAPVFGCPLFETPDEDIPG